MSARYPLVRNSYAFATRFGVSRKPSRPGSSPSSFSSLVISSCILLSHIPAAAQSPDALYAARTQLASAGQAADIWRAELARDAAAPVRFDAAWKLARAEYWLGGHASEREAGDKAQRDAFERGIAAAQTAIKL